jgi:hypothetical protein
MYTPFIVIVENASNDLSTICTGSISVKAANSAFCERNFEMNSIGEKIYKHQTPLRLLSILIGISILNEFVLDIVSLLRGNLKMKRTVFFFEK